MLSRLLFVRLKSAENALRDGRIDEAFRLAASPDLREHRRGRDMLAQLADRFIERARDHFRVDRFAEALSDLEKARMGEIRLEEIAELRHNIEIVATEAQRQEASRREHLEQARRRVQAGSLAAGRNLIEGALKDHPDARRLERTIEQRGAEAQFLVEQAQDCLDKGQWVQAAERLESAKKLDAHHGQAGALETQLCRQALAQARKAVQEGRLSIASETLRQLRSLGASMVERRTIEEFLQLAKQVWRSMGARDHARTRGVLSALSGLMPGVKWVDKLMKQIKTLEELDVEIKGSPLGQWMDLDAGEASKDAPDLHRPAPSLEETLVVSDRSNGAEAIPRLLWLLVDGAGSYLVVRGDQVSIGRAASNQPADVPLFSDLAERHARIARVDEDYFLFSSKDVEIGGKSYKQQLLREGDRVTMGRRAKFEFKLPSRKSLTATLALSDTTKAPNDVRHVLLFHEHATIGATSAAHVVHRGARRSLVLFERDGRLWIKPNDARASEQPIEIGKPIDLEGVSLVIQPWRLRHAPWTT